VELFADARFESAMHDTNELMVLGRGTNILFTKDVQATVLHLRIEDISVVSETDMSLSVRVGAGMEWSSFVDHAVTQGWAGIENLACIPGTVGAAPVQNIGAYGVEVSELIEAVHVYDRTVCGFLVLSNHACAFAYRDSLFKRADQGRFIITHVDFRLSKRPHIRVSYGAVQSELLKLGIKDLSLSDMARMICSIRWAKLPHPEVIGNAGSFFKNPLVSSEHVKHLLRIYPEMPHHAVGSDYKVPAAWLIEQAGWKGYREGDAGCYEKQPLVLVNFGKATGEEILSLSKRIQLDVFSKFDVQLVPEVNIL
jgi:UDP-N-acetylmuramate dehydrogenase